MKITLSIIMFFSSLTLSFSQAKHDYVWLSGYCPECVGEPDSFGITELNFNSEDLIPYRNDEITMTFNITNATMCDPEGNLLFYTNGCRIMTAEHGLMEYGDSLNYNDDEWWLQCDPVVGFDAYTVVKGAVVLPQAGQSDKYYIFHLPIHTLSTGVTVLSLQYTVVDMTLAGGLGAVTEKNVPIVEDTLNTTFLTAVKHANGEDWWVVLPRRGSDLYHKVLLTADGPQVMPTQNVGEPVHRFGGASGQAVFSPDGTKYASYSNRDQCYLMDFDNATGELSNFRRLTVRDTFLFPGGAAFSPSSRYLYVSSNDYLHQFDTWAEDVQASRVEIAQYDGERIHGWPTRYFTMQLAPDCRIYMISTNAVPAMHVIHHPDEPGLACGFDQNGLRLPTFNSFSQPNFPNYRLGTPYPVCDSSIALITSTVRVGPPPEAGVRVWPNPANGTVNLGLPRPSTANSGWRLYSGTGALVREAVLPAGQNIHRMDVSGLPGGLYFWELRGGDGKVGGGKLVLE